MRKWARGFLVFLFTEWGLLLAQPLDPSLLGVWTFEHMIYQDKPMEPSDPTLKIRFEFAADSSSDLKWSRREGVVHCWRKGQWKLVSEGGRWWLHEKSTWVDPENSPACGDDPDMVVGRTTQTEISFPKDDVWFLHLGLGGEELIYVWSRQGPKP